MMTMTPNDDNFELENSIKHVKDFKLAIEFKYLVGIIYFRLRVFEKIFLYILLLIQHDLR